MIPVPELQVGFGAGSLGSGRLEVCVGSMKPYFADALRKGRGSEVKDDGE